MKAHLVFLLPVLGWLAVTGGRAAATAPAAVVEVVFDHPENFTDAKDGADPTVAGRDAILNALRHFIIVEAGRLLPPGSRLTMTFADIDLAGDFEPWRGPQFDNIRVVKPIYPPAFKFSYRVTDAGGRILKQGQESIRDPNFELRSTLDTTDSLRFEKDILREWLEKNLRGL